VTKYERDVSVCGVFALAYILTRVEMQQVATAAPAQYVGDAVSGYIVQEFHLKAVKLYKLRAIEMNDCGLYEYCTEVAHYVRALFNDINQGNSHVMNLVACSHDRVFQFYETCQEPGEVKPMAMF